MHSAQDLISSLNLSSQDEAADIKSLSPTERLFKQSTSLVLAPVMFQSFPLPSSISLVIINRLSPSKDEKFVAHLANGSTKQVNAGSSGYSGFQSNWILPHFLPGMINYDMCLEYATLLTVLGFDVHMFSLDKKSKFQLQVDAGKVEDFKLDVFHPKYAPEVLMVLQSTDFFKLFGFEAI